MYIYICNLLHSQRHKVWNMVKIDLISILKILPNVKSAKRNRFHKSKTTVSHRKDGGRKKYIQIHKPSPCHDKTWNHVFLESCGQFYLKEGHGWKQPKQGGQSHKSCPTSLTQERQPQQEFLKASYFPISEHSEVLILANPIWATTMSLNLATYNPEMQQCHGMKNLWYGTKNQWFWNTNEINEISQLKAA